MWQYYADYLVADAHPTSYFYVDPTIDQRRWNGKTLVRGPYKNPFNYKHT
jgi:hypothetical protein